MQCFTEFIVFFMFYGKTNATQCFADFLHYSCFTEKQMQNNWEYFYEQADETFYGDFLYFPVYGKMNAKQYCSCSMNGVMQYFTDFFCIFHILRKNKCNTIMEFFYKRDDETFYGIFIFSTFYWKTNAKQLGVFLRTRWCNILQIFCIFHVLRKNKQKTIL